MIKKVSLGLAGLAVVATAAFAGSHAGPHAGAIGARQAHMQLYAFNLGILGSMAKGEAEYNAEAAQAAATSLATLAQLPQAAYWPAGSDNSAAEGTKALPAIWADFPGVMAASTQMVEASVAMEAAAGNGLEALQGAMGGVGAACGTCHKSYRAR